MGSCLSCLGRSIPNEGVRIQSSPSVDIQHEEPSPTTLPQGLSKSARKRQRSRLAKQQIQSQLTESTPLLDSTDPVPDYQVIGTDLAIPPSGNHRPTSSEFFAFDTIDFEPYLQHAKDMAARTDNKSLWLRPHWQSVYTSLKTKVYISTACFNPKYLDYDSLSKMYESQPEKIVTYLCVLARGHDNLKDITDHYINPLLMNEYSPLSMMDGQPTFIRMDYLKSGRYYVRNFFTALHVILLHLLPPEQGLKEYLRIFMMLQKLLSRVLQKYQNEYLGHSVLQIPSKMAMAVLVPSRAFAQRVQFPSCVIGFSLVGSDSVRRAIIKERHENMPVLKSVSQRHPFDWPVGNCAEAEALAYVYRVPQSRAVGDVRFRLHYLTLDLMTTMGKPEPACEQCKQTVNLLRKQHPILVTVDLAPGRNRKQAGTQFAGQSRI